MTKDQATVALIFLWVIMVAALIVAIVLPGIADVLRDVLAVLENTQ